MWVYSERYRCASCNHYFYLAEPSTPARALTRMIRRATLKCRNCGSSGSSLIVTKYSGNTSYIEDAATYESMRTQSWPAQDGIQTAVYECSKNDCRRSHFARYALPAEASKTCEHCASPLRLAT